jgi:DNA-directed RNA polymerase subunit G
MSLELVCNIDSMKDSYIPEIKIVEMSCENNARVKMDVHRKVNIFNVRDKVLLIISKTMPQYNEGRDFVAHGYIISKRTENDNIVVYISLWGFLVILSLQNDEKIVGFNPTDKVYVKASRIA